jgi:hypothetical protein
VVGVGVDRQVGLGGGHQTPTEVARS